MRTIAIEEHFTTPMYRANVPANEFRNFYLTSRSGQLGHDIVAQLADLGAERIARMDAAGVDVQVLSFGSPGPQAFAPDLAVPMARDANDLAFEAVKAAAEELERCVAKLGFKGAMIHGHTRGEFLDDRKYWVIFERAQALEVPIYMHQTLPPPDVVRANFGGYEEPAHAG